MLRTAQQNTQLHALIGKLGIDKDLKEELVAKFTSNRETSSAQMQYGECQDLINHLLQIAGGSHSQEWKASNKMRRKILMICHEIGWETPSGKVDFSRLNAWLLKFGYLHKANLNEYKYNELPTVVSQFEQLQRHYYAKR